MPHGPQLSLQSRHLVRLAGELLAEECCCLLEGGLKGAAPLKLTRTRTAQRINLRGGVGGSVGKWVQGEGVKGRVGRVWSVERHNR